MSQHYVNLEAYYIEGKKYVKLACHPDDTTREELKQINGCRWDDGVQGWILEHSREALSSIFRIFHKKAWVNTDGLFA
ncbi:MAG: hypothetical protein KDD36_09490 [Flavobacteriales bacterium]|nr:hypothetical protein [Flavobacteriales bacterium]